MRNYIATCVIAAASLASCTQNEDFTSQYNEKAKTMKFDVAYVGKNTRATGDLTSIDDKKFILWGAAYQLPSSGSGTTESPTGIWITDQEPLYFKKGSTYWEGFKEEDCSTSAEVAYPGANYKTYFTAIAPADEFASTSTTGKVDYSMAGQKDGTSKSPSSSTRKLTLDNIPVVQEIDNTADTKKGTDYLIACYNGTTEEVALTFKHLLSKLRFAVWTDENTMKTSGSETTKITLNEIKIYLPKADAKAMYIQDNHNNVAGTWTWSDFTSSETAPTAESLENYQQVTLITSGTKEVNYYDGATSAHSATWDDVKLTTEDKTFFIAPNGNTNCKLYMDITYTVSRKVEDKWSTTNDASAAGDNDVYSAGHKVVTRTGMAIPVNDNNHPDDNNNNEGLSHFHQGYIETLYICLRADQKVTFSTEFTVDDWVDDPINGKQQ